LAFLRFPAVSFFLRHAPELLEYSITDTDSDEKVLVTTSDYLSVVESLAKKLNLTLLVIDQLDKCMPMVAVQQQRGSIVDAWTLRNSTSS
jgi:hypothetical protein